MTNFDRAMHMLERFEREASLLPVEAEELFMEVLRASGHKIIEKGFIGAGREVDCFFEAELDGRRSRIGVELNFSPTPIGPRSVSKALALKDSGHFDRAIIVARSGFNAPAIEDGILHGAGFIDLLGPKDLRNWLEKFREPTSLDLPCVQIVRAASRQLAARLALHPEELPTVEWRQLEQILREVFDGMGFDTTLTRPGKDGGFDLEVSSGSDHYLIEVKHWRDKKPGLPFIKRLIEVSASRSTRGSLFISTSGFAKTVYGGLIDCTVPLRLGEGPKLISLCKTYYRLRTGFWIEEPQPLEEALFSDTVQPGTADHRSGQEVCALACVGCKPTLKSQLDTFLQADYGACSLIFPKSYGRSSAPNLRLAASDAFGYCPTSA